jgi:hypothetical protein
MSYDDTISTTIDLADQAAAEAKASDDAAFIQPAGPAERRLHEHLMGLPADDLRRLAVVAYCGREGTSNVHVADNIIHDTPERLVGQLMSKPKLGEYLRVGRTLVPVDRLQRLECVG